MWERGIVTVVALQPFDLDGDLVGIEVDSLVAVKDLLVEDADWVFVCEDDPVGPPPERGDAQSAAAEAEQIAIRAQPEPEIELPGPGDIVVPLRIRHGDRELAFFSTVSTFGTPLDITVAELAIESFFPADPATTAFLRDGRA